MIYNTFEQKLTDATNAKRNNVMSLIQSNKDKERLSYKPAVDDLNSFITEYNTKHKLCFRGQPPHGELSFDRLFPHACVVDKDINMNAIRKSEFLNTLNSCENEEESHLLLMDDMKFFELAKQYGYVGTELVRLNNRRHEILEHAGFHLESTPVNIENAIFEDKHLTINNNTGDVNNEYKTSKSE